MNRTMRCVGVGVLFSVGFGADAMRAQQPVAAEPQASSQTVQTPRELVPTLPVPRLVKFAGTLKDAQGNPRSGVVGVTFAIYREQEGGAALWVETQNVQLDELGHYAVLLGVTKNEGLPVELFAAAEPRWLGVQLAGEVEEPRVLLVSVPYALRAADAENLGGRPASAYALAGGAAGTGANGGTGGTDTGTGLVPPKNRVTGPGGKATPQLITASFIPVFTDNNGTLGNSLLVQSGNSMALGQGVSGNGTIQFDVNGGIRGTGLATNGRSVSVDAINTGALFLGGSNAMGVIGASTVAVAPGAPFTKTSFYSGGVERMTVIGTTGNVGIGTITPGQRLSVAGMIESISGGFKFPDGSIQTTAGGGGGGTITAVNTPSGSGLMGGATSGAANLSLINSCVAGQVLQWSGTAWVCASVGGIGTVTSVGSGLGLTGGPIMTAGTLAIDTTVVPQLAANPLVATVPAGTSITNGTCITVKVAAPGVTTSMVAIISPSGNPAANGLPDVLWSAFVDSAGSVTAEICKIATTTAKAISNQDFNLRVIK